MGFANLIMIAFFAFRNANRATQKEKNPILWALLTVVSFFVAALIGMFVVVFGFCGDIINYNKFATITDIKARDAYMQGVSEQLVQDFNANPLHPFTILFFGIGGYLFIRYMLDRIPDKKKPEVHWMDKVGESEQQ